MFPDGLLQKLQKKKKPTRWLMNVDHITDYSLHSINSDEIVYFLVQPTNISVLSNESLSARVYALMNVLKGFAEAEMLCLDSRESFENNKRFLRERAVKEDIPEIRSLLEQENRHLDRIQVQMATTREFLIIVRLGDQKKQEVFPYLGRIEKLLSEQGFKVRRADKEDMEAEGLDLREQYPRQYAALDELGEKLSTFVEFAAEEYLRMLENGETASLYLVGRARDFDVEMEGNGMLWDTVSEMLGERLSEYNLDMEIDNGDLIFTPREPEMDMGM